MSEDNTNLFDFAWGKVIGGLLFLGASWWLHGLFSELEAGSRESVRINWIAAVLYKTAGPTGTVVIFVGVGVMAIIFGIRQLFSEGSGTTGDRA